MPIPFWNADNLLFSDGVTLTPLKLDILKLIEYLSMFHWCPKRCFCELIMVSGIECNVVYLKISLTICNLLMGNPGLQGWLSIILYCLMPTSSCQQGIVATPRTSSASHRAGDAWICPGEFDPRGKRGTGDWAGEPFTLWWMVGKSWHAMGTFSPCSAYENPFAFRGFGFGEILREAVCFHHSGGTHFVKQRSNDLMWPNQVLVL